MERTNVRDADARGRCRSSPELVVADLSFISLGSVAAALARLGTAACGFVVLVKPQFEAGPDDVGRGGVVRDPDVWRRVLVRGERGGGRRPGWHRAGVMASPLPGPAGNVEFLLELRRGRAPVGPLSATGRRGRDRRGRGRCGDERRRLRGARRPRARRSPLRASSEASLAATDVASVDLDEGRAGGRPGGLRRRRRHVPARGAPRGAGAGAGARREGRASRVPHGGRAAGGRAASIAERARRQRADRGAAGRGRRARRRRRVPARSGRSTRSWSRNAPATG